MRIILLYLLLIALILSFRTDPAFCAHNAIIEEPRADPGTHSSDHEDGELARAPKEVQWACGLLFGFYRTCVSPFDGSKCGFIPSCSRFGQESIRADGFQGLLMTSDRLQRCHGCSGHLYARHINLGLSFDPVSDNVLWGPSRRIPSRQVRDGGEQSQKEILSPDIGTLAVSRYGIDQEEDVPRDGKVTTPVNSTNDRTVPYYEAESLMKFAEHLTNRGDYLRAAGEYERILFVLPENDSRRWDIEFLLGKNLLCAKAPTRAAAHFEGLLADQISADRKQEVIRQLVICDFELGRYAEARNRLNLGRIMQSVQPGAGFSAGAAPDITREIVCASYLFEARYEEAVAALAGPNENRPSDLSPFGIALRNLATQGLNAPRKSETLAGLLSALVPGTGKIYTGRTADGVFSFLATGFCAWQAVDGFHRDGSGSTKGWIFGGVGSVFYAGNIYGSILSARIHNQKIQLGITSRTKSLISGLSCRF